MFGFGFKFIDPGPLINGELSLVAPSQKLLDDLVHAEVLSGAIDPEGVRRRNEEFLLNCPGGRERSDRLAGKVPAYHFWMKIDRRHPAGMDLPVLIAGGLGLRIGRNVELEYYSGNVGYHVYPPARGRHYAERAVRLILPLAKRHGISPLWITTNPDNEPSRRTCQRLGATLQDTVDIPPNHPFRSRGETQKCRYRLDL